MTFIGKELLEEFIHRYLHSVLLRSTFIKFLLNLKNALWNKFLHLYFVFVFRLHILGNLEKSSKLFESFFRKLFEKLNKHPFKY